MNRILIIILLFHHVCNAQGKAWKSDAAPLHRAQRALTDVIVHDIFSPPAASRIYAYSNIAAFEVLVKQNQDYRSFGNQLNGMPAMPAAPGKICFSLAAVNAFLTTGKSLVFSESILQDSANNIMQWYKNKEITNDEFEASISYGKQVAMAVMQWAAQDHYRETRSLRRYKLLKEEGKWLPTPPVYMAAVEPYWNRIRPMVLDSCTQFRPALAMPFSTDKNSKFYREALEVYDTAVRLSRATREIAAFWDCNPFAVSTEGHLNFAVKKISPGGHWMSIAGIACRNINAGMMKTAAIYSLTAITLFDAFIICWDEKYRSNVIRPETYINKYIDESWRPLLQTPPFPEYTSGHSVISTAAAAVLTSILGDNVGFDDDTEVEFGLPVKHFASFTLAAEEAAISRLYGGIHYRAAIENGQKQGIGLGEWMIKKISITNRPNKL